MASSLKILLGYVWRKGLNNQRMALFFREGGDEAIRIVNTKNNQEIWIQKALSS